MQFNFDASTVDPNPSFDPIPAGKYVCKINETEMKPTKDPSNDNMYLKLTLEVIDGEHAGRLLFDNLNLKNTNPTASEIAYATLSAICHATGQIQLQDTQQLHGIPMLVKVKIKAADGNYDASNDVKGYEKAEGAGQAAPAAGFAQPAAGFAHPAQGFAQPTQAAPVQAAPVQAAPLQAAPAGFAQPQAAPVQAVPAAAAGTKPPWET